MKLKQKLSYIAILIAIFGGVFSILPGEPVSAQAAECWVGRIGDTECKSKDSFGEDDSKWQMTGRVNGNGALCNVGATPGDPAYKANCKSTGYGCLSNQSSCSGSGATDEETPGTAEEDEPDCAPGSEGCCGGVKTSIISGELCQEDEGGVIFGLLKGALRILTAGIGIAAIGGIAYGALLYTTAENKPDQTKRAIGIITNVVIGIAAYALMFALVNFLIPGGIFT